MHFWGPMELAKALFAGSLRTDSGNWWLYVDRRSELYTEIET